MTIRKTEEGFRDFKKVHSDVPIPGGSDISDIINEAVESGTWTAITLPSEGQIACKGISGGMRDGTDWKMSHLSDGARYRTIKGALGLDIAKGSGGTLFYVQSLEANGTFEVILLD